MLFEIKKTEAIDDAFLIQTTFLHLGGYSAKYFISILTRKEIELIVFLEVHVGQSVTPFSNKLCPLCTLVILGMQTTVFLFEKE